MPLEIHVLSNIKNAVGPRQMMIMPGMVNPGERVALLGLRLLVDELIVRGDNSGGKLVDTSQTVVPGPPQNPKVSLRHGAKLLTGRQIHQHLGSGVERCSIQSSPVVQRRRRR